MKQVKEEFEVLTHNEAGYSNNFETSCGVIPRKLFLFHTLQYIAYIKNQSATLTIENQTLGLENLKEIRPEDSTTLISKKIGEVFAEIADQKKEGEEIDEDDIIAVIFRTFKSEIYWLLFMFVFDSIFRLGFSVVIVYLLDAVTEGNLTMAYILASALMVIWYLSQLFKQTATIDTQLLLYKLKAGLAMLLYGKVSTLTSYSLKASHSGKISNLLSNDLAAIQQQLSNMTSFVIFPILLIGYTVILVLRIGWVGIIGTIMIISMIPIARCVSQYNANIIKEVNIYKDKRVQITTEVIQGMRYVKLYGWEGPFRKFIHEIRAKELSAMKKLALGKSFEKALGYFMSAVASLVMIVVGFYATGIEYSSVLSVLEIISALKMNVLMFTMGTGYYYQLKVIFGRFASIFNIKKKSMININCPERKIQQRKTATTIASQLIINSQSRIVQPMQEYNEEKDNNLNYGDVMFSNFNGYWNEDLDNPFLKNINLTFKTGTLYGVTGKVGSGKSALLGAILGELPYYSGELLLKGSVAYVEQEPISFSTTVRNNITFGKQFDQAKYDRAVQLSCMEADFRILPQGDQTVVGEKGTTLSGGQKARLALARAIYSDADIFLLDDPISAVDSKVGKLIFEQCIRPLSREKTVILTTHQVSYLHHCDQSIIIEDGRIFISGSPRQIEQHLLDIAKSFEAQEEDKEQNQEKQEDIEEIISLGIATDKDSQNNNPPLSRQNSADSATRFIEKKAEVSSSTYTSFLFAVKRNYFFIPLIIILYVVTEGIILMFFRFMADFKNVQRGDSSIFGGNFNLYWGILSGLLLIYFLLQFFEYYLFQVQILESTEQIHNNMVESILASPMRFFESTPSGILLNKFSSDLGIADKGVITGLDIILNIASYFFIAIVNICQINPYFAIPAAAFIIVSVIFYSYSRAGIIGCRQLDLQNKNPIFHFFSEAIAGLTQVRILHRKQQRIQQFAELINRSSKASIAYDILSRGFGFYVTVFSVFLLAMGMYLGIMQSSSEDSNLFGITILYLISVSQMIRRIFRESVLVDSYMVSVQRLLELQNLDKEKDLRTNYDRTIGLQAEVDAAERQEDLHVQWPQRSVLEVRNLTAKYKPTLPPVLKGISFAAKEGEKVGIVGRTGAGKSSIANALFRTFEPEEGSVYRIDKYNALEMGLHSLRQHISVIPQFPFVFKGTIKQNLDPFETASEEKMWEALEKAGLSEQVSKLPDKMETVISNNSETFSVGQKQLLCLARALLRRNKFLVLDQATANVDMQTDALIQKVIRESFAGTTVITIAHRLDTIADYDKILVMRKGKVAEEGSPFELIEKKGLFYRMVQHVGKNADTIIIRARRSFSEK